MIVKVKEERIAKVQEKREFLEYIIGIKRKIKIQMMLSEFTQHRKNKCIHTLKKCCILQFSICKILGKKI